uniref:Tropinone reductase like n=1 Tax=Rhizophora mucronata TaxID=61149 RepID=A0A2P2KI44_RHIMU
MSIKGFLTDITSLLEEISRISWFTLLALLAPSQLTTKLRFFQKFSTPTDWRNRFGRDSTRLPSDNLSNFYTINFGANQSINQSLCIFCCCTSQQ